MRLLVLRMLGTLVRATCRVVVAAVMAACVCVPACTPKQYASQADKAAYGLIEDKQLISLGYPQRFNIDY